MTADELAAKGERLNNMGHFVVYLYPCQEWMAVEVQIPFLRYGLIPKDKTMPTLAGDPLRKVTLNLYEADCAILERQYGRGWTTIVRDLTNDRARLLRQSLPYQGTLGDLDDRN